MPSLTKSNAESKRAAKAIVDAILQTYPDFGKAQPHYIIGLVDVVESYPEKIQRAFADKRTGIAARCKFLPTIADFVAMAGELVAAENAASSDRARIADLAARIEARRKSAEPQQTYKPLPRYFAPNGVEITEREAKERLERHKANVANEAMLKRRRAYTLELGNGDIERGEMIMLKRGIAEVPNDWEQQA